MGAGLYKCVHRSHADSLLLRGSDLQHWANTALSSKAFPAFLVLKRKSWRDMWGFLSFLSTFCVNATKGSLPFGVTVNISDDCVSSTVLSSADIQPPQVHSSMLSPIHHLLSEHQHDQHTNCYSLPFSQAKHILSSFSLELQFPLLPPNLSCPSK